MVKNSLSGRSSENPTRKESTPQDKSRRQLITIGESTIVRIKLLSIKRYAKPSAKMPSTISEAKDLERNLTKKSSTENINRLSHAPSQS